MPYLVSHTPAASTKQKSFNGIRRTKDGMLYLTSVNPNLGNETIEVSKFYEDGKSDFVGRDQQDYVDEIYQKIIIFQQVKRLICFLLLEKLMKTERILIILLNFWKKQII